ncbi:NtaA/DmoA family FMN-dependent monooxygenase [Sphingobium yanoikuyae]|nr:NtaA/DmoA family FMN-dependent monooxygenase [Sphingobium yanoikuyae]
MPKQLHLCQMFFYSPISNTILSWADPDDRQIEGLTSFSYWQDIARTLEQGCFDAVFLADTQVARSEYEGQPDAALKYGVVWPAHDPVPIAAVMASATEHLGIAITQSTAGTAPYVAMRKLSTLDCLSHGRVAWNIVTGGFAAEHFAVGVGTAPDTETRYAQADEYVAICKQLWDSVPADAILADRSTGIFADPSKIKRVDFEGSYLRCKAVSAALPSPQGYPVLVMAGASGPGVSFAAHHAEVVFANQPTVEAMRAVQAKFDAAAAEIGREEPIRILFGVQVIVADDREGAQRIADRLAAKVPLEASLARLSSSIGIDLSTFDPDEPFTPTQGRGSQGHLASYTSRIDGRQPTLREVAGRVAISSGAPQVFGSPQEVADQLEQLWRDTGCHGFNIYSPIVPAGIDRFVKDVVPLLQEKGIFRRRYEGRNLRENIVGD